MCVYYYTLFQKYWVLPKNIHTDHTHPTKVISEGNMADIFSDMVSVLVYLKRMGSWSLVFFVRNVWIFPGMTHLVK